MFYDTWLIAPVTISQYTLRMGTQIWICMMESVIEDVAHAVHVPIKNEAFKLYFFNSLWVDGEGGVCHFVVSVCFGDGVSFSW